MAFGMISELMDQYIDFFPIFDLSDNIFSFCPAAPYIRLHNRLIFKNHSLICRFLCIQNVLVILPNILNVFFLLSISNTILIQYSKKWIDNLEWCRFLFRFIQEKKTNCMYKKGKTTYWHWKLTTNRIRNTFNDHWIFQGIKLATME